MLSPMARPIAPPATMPIGPAAMPTNAPMAVPKSALSFLICCFLAFERGARVVPFHARVVRVVESFFSRLHARHAGLRLLPWSVPPFQPGTDGRTLHAGQGFQPGRIPAREL